MKTENFLVKLYGSDEFQDSYTRLASVEEIYFLEKAYMRTLTLNLKKFPNLKKVTIDPKNKSDVIAHNLFKDSKSIEEVTLSPFLRTIQNNLFTNCTSLRKVNMSDNVQFIGCDAFRNTAIKTFTFPKNISLINRGAFAGSQLEDIIVPKEVVLNTIYLDTFYGTPFYKKIIQNKNTIFYINNVAVVSTYETTDVDLNIKSGTTNVSDSFFDLSNRAQHFYLTLPETLEVFNCSTYSYNIEEVRVSSIEQYCKIYCPCAIANENTKLIVNGVVANEITVPDTIKYVRCGTFNGWQTIRKVTISKNVSSVDGWAFASSGIEEVVFEGPITLGSAAFKSCKHLKKIEFKDVPNLNYNSIFSDCSSLNDIKIPEGLTVIGKSVFAYCNINSIVLPSSITKIEDCCFLRANINNLTITAGKRKIKKDTFYGVNVINLHVKNKKGNKEETFVNIGDNIRDFL